MMRISATGADPRDGGFTLVEMMVVLVVLGLMAAVVVVALPSSQMTLGSESERFAARLKRAQEESILTNRPVEVSLTQVGYGFRVRTVQGWQPLTDGPFGPEAWSPQTKAQGAQNIDRIVFDPTGVATPGRFVLTRNGQSAEVTVDEAGNVVVDAR